MLFQEGVGCRASSSPGCLDFSRDLKNQEGGGAPVLLSVSLPTASGVCGLVFNLTAPGLRAKSRVGVDSSWGI